MQRLRNLRARILEELRKAFHEKHTDREIAGSFSIGVFITSLPTLGLGLLLFAVLDRFFESISRLSLVASVVVLNPLVKPLFYLASINLGGIILTRRVAVVRDPETALTFLIVGNLVIAVVASILAYFFALRAVRSYRDEGLDVVKEVEEKVEEEIDEFEEKG